MVCIYCGVQQQSPGAPAPPISFNSTSAYRCLLESLQADGSEVVTLGTATSDSSGHKSTPRDGVVLLSDLLNLELTWLELEDIQNISVNKAPSLSEPSLNLTGVDLDNFFSDSRSEMVFDVSVETSISKLTEGAGTQVPSAQEGLTMFESTESSMPSEQSVGEKGHVSSAKESLSMFRDIQTSDKTVNSADAAGDEFGDPSSWEADFQSACSGALPVDMKPVDPFMVSSTMNSSRPAEAPATFDSGSDIKFEINQSRSGKTENNPDQSTSANDWIQIDTWSTDKVSNKTEDFESSSKGNDSESKNDWMGNDLLQMSNIKVLNNAKKNNGIDDSDIDKIDINRGDRRENHPDQLSSVANNWVQDDVWNTNNSEVFDKTEHFEGNNKANYEEFKDDWMGDDLWQTSNTNALNNAEKTNKIDAPDIDQGNSGKNENNPDPLSSSIGNNWIEDDIWNTSNSRASNMTQNFVSSSGANDGEFKNDWMGNELWQTSNTNMLNVAEEINDTDDSSDIWQDFTSSQDKPDPLLSSWSQMGTGNTLSNGHTSEINSMNLIDDSKQMEFGTFLQPDLFSGDSGIQKGATDLNIVQLETSPSDRIERKEVKSEVVAESRTADDGIGNLAATTSAPSADPIVGMLISQMPDLSFMFENGLSIPKKG